MEEITLKHNTKKWLNFRSKGIGGSDAGAVLGLSPFANKRDIYFSKINNIHKDLSNNPAVKYGSDAEDLLVGLFQLDYPEYQVEIIKNKVFKQDFMFASLDGLLTEKTTGDKGILEIKTTTIRNRQMLEEWDNKIPDYYYAQILHYMAVIKKAKFCILKVQMKDTDINNNLIITTKHYKWTREEMEEDIQELIKQEMDFWNNHILKKIPPNYTIADF